MCATQILVKTVVLVYQRILLMTASVCWDGLDLIVKVGSIEVVFHADVLMDSPRVVEQKGVTDP